MFSLKIDLAKLIIPFFTDSSVVVVVVVKYMIIVDTVCGLQHVSAISQ